MPICRSSRCPIVSDPNAIGNALDPRSAAHALCRLLALSIGYRRNAKRTPFRRRNQIRFNTTNAHQGLLRNPRCRARRVRGRDQASLSLARPQASPGRRRTIKPTAEHRFKEINEAYEVLSDPKSARNTTASAPSVTVGRRAEPRFSASARQRFRRYLRHVLRRTRAAPAGAATPGRSAAPICATISRLRSKKRLRARPKRFSSIASRRSANV